MIIEAPDISLGCVGYDQWWVDGIMRTTSLATPSGQWELYVPDPALVPKVKWGCGIQYPRLFESMGVIYLSYWVYVFMICFSFINDKRLDPMQQKTEMQIYQLVEGKGLVPMIASIPPSS